MNGAIGCRCVLEARSGAERGGAGGGRGARADFWMLVDVGRPAASPSRCETFSPRINNSRTEKWKHLPQEPTTQEQKMIVATITISFREKSVVILYTELDSCEENPSCKLNLQYPMPETQLNLERVGNLHLTAVLLIAKYIVIVTQINSDIIEYSKTE